MNHKIIFTEDKMFVNGTKVKDYKKSLPKKYEMMGAIKAITLDNVLLQENGILRDENGLLIARLVDSVKFDDIENRLKIAENKVRIKEVQQFYLALTMAEELKPYSKIFHNIAKKRLEELEFWNLNRKKGE